MAESPKFVQVRVSGSAITVDPESCQVNANKHWVEWEGNEPFSIDFAHKHIEKPSGNRDPDGEKYRVKSKVFADHHIGRHKYTITSGSIVLDPDIEVIPGP